MGDPVDRLIDDAAFEQVAADRPREVRTEVARRIRQPRRPDRNIQAISVAGGVAVLAALMLSTRLTSPPAPPPPAVTDSRQVASPESVDAQDSQGTLVSAPNTGPITIQPLERDAITPEPLTIRPLTQ